MSLIDDVNETAAENEAAAQTTPSGWTPQHEQDEDGNGSIVTTPYPGTLQIPDHKRLLEDHGLDPEKYEIVGSVRLSQWRGGKGGTWLTAFRFSYQKIGAERKGSQHDLPLLYASIREEPTPARRPAITEQNVQLLAFADMQLGKTSHRGGTPETIRRIKRAREEACEIIAARNPEGAIYADLGDGLENFESGGNPAFLNDLSLPDQLDLYATTTYENIMALRDIAPVTACVIQSNHAQWRRGQQRLGTPADDFGIMVFKMVQKMVPDDVEFIFPEPYREHLALDVYGTRIGMVHGNQFGPGKVHQYWSDFSHGGTSLADAEVLLFGHYHTASITTQGRTPTRQRAKYAVGVPCLDAGSDWYANLRGADGDPGYAILNLRPDGFLPEDLTFHMLLEEPMAP